MAEPDPILDALNKRLETPQPQPRAGGGDDQTLEMLNRRLESPGSASRQPPQPYVPAATSPAPGAAVGPPNDPSMTFGPAPEPPPTMAGKLVGRLFGTDVEDPLQWTRLGAVVAGAIGGGSLGLRAPGPPTVKGAAAALGATAGTAAGAIAPEMTMEALEYVGAMPEGTRRRTGLSDEDLMTVLEGEVLLELATAGGIGALRAGSRTISSLLTGATRNSRALAEAGTREGIAMLPVQVGERSVGRGFVSVMGRFPWVASALKKRANRSMDQIRNSFEGIPARFAPLTTFDEASARIFRDANNTLEAINNGYTRQIDDLMGQAAARGIRISPVNTRSVTERIMTQLQRDTPEGLAGSRGRLPRGSQTLQRFIRENTQILFDNRNFAPQSFRQMRTILTNIDEMMPTLAKQGDATSMGRLEQLRQAVQMDMIGNAVGPRNSGADHLVSEISRLDNELTMAVTGILDTAAARRTGIQVHPSGRSGRMTGGGTRSPDSLARVLLRDGGPEMVDELARMATPQTMRHLTSAVMNEAIQTSVQRQADDTFLFNVDEVARKLGLDDPQSAKFLQTERLMQHSGGMNMDQLQQLVEIARRASRAEIPDVSTFIARRATMGGINTAVKTVAPWAVVSGAGMTGGAIMSLMAIGGSKLFANIISDPRSARALSRVMDLEARTTIRRSAAIRAMTFGVYNMQSAGEITRETANNMIEAYTAITDEIEKHVGQTPVNVFEKGVVGTLSE